MRNLRFLKGCGLISLALGLSACDTVQILPAEEEIQVIAQPIINGTRVTGQEHKAVVVLYFSYYGQKSSFCTGTLIAPQYVLTAAHCVTDTPDTPKDERVEPMRPNMRVGVGNSVGTSIGGYTIASFHSHPGYGGKELDNDIAILKLSSAVPNTVAVPVPPLPPSKAFNRSHLADKVPIEVVGFGQTVANDDDSSGDKYKISLFVAGVCGWPEVKPSEIRCHVSSGMYASWGTFYYYSNKGGACYGDSGGPVFYTYDGVQYVAGVTSSGYGQCNSLDVVTRVPDFYTFIEDLVPGLPAEEKENCDNGVDDNNDKRVDCLDPYCMGLAKCIPEDCTNGKDDNGDNSIDCADLQCKAKKICVPEIYNNNIDENGDTLVDCDDPQCKDILRCQPEDCTNGKDDNGDNLIDCEDPKCERIIYCIQEHCSNGKDDNANKLVDCADPQCAWDPACQTEDCSNKVDDNNNGRIDCDDKQCTEDPHCLPEVCDNKIDDNFNTLADCKDPLCASFTSCLPEVCDNNKDDNGDGNIDCDEDSCKNTEHCESAKSAQACSYSSHHQGHWPWGLGFLAFVAIFTLRRRAQILPSRGRG